MADASDSDSGSDEDGGHDATPGSRLVAAASRGHHNVPKGHHQHNHDSKAIVTPLDVATLDASTQVQ